MDKRKKADCYFFLLLLFGRLYRFARRSFGWCFGWLVDLEFFFQFLNQCRQLLLSLTLNLLSQASFHPSAFLAVTRFKLSTFLRAQVKAGVAKRRLSLASDGLASQILSLAHNVALFGTHSQPTLGMALEVLARRRGHCHPSVAHARTSWSTRRSGR